jgi:hypothetical protein
MGAMLSNIVDGRRWDWSLQFGRLIWDGENEKLYSV